MVTSTVARTRDAAQIGVLLDSPEITGLITQLEATRWTGRPGYPVRAMVGLALIKVSTYFRPGRVPSRWSVTTLACGSCLARSRPWTPLTGSR